MMSTDRTSDDHLTPEELFGFIERRHRRRKRLRIEEHLDQCTDCVEYLASVLRSKRSEAENIQEALDHTPARSPEEILQRLRPHIIATSPATASRAGTPWAWRQWAPAAAAVAVLLVGFVAVQKLVISPARGRQLATRAITELATLRQGTGRIPLRYIPEFQRARVTRSGFDTTDPAEEQIEAQLRRAVELAPRVLESQVAMGLFLLDTGALAEAEEKFREALEIDPKSTAAKNGWAVVHYERALRDPQRAQHLLRQGLALLREARRESPGDLQVAFNMAVLYQQLGSADAAKRAWSYYLELDPGSEWAEMAAEKLEDLGGR